MEPNQVLKVSVNAVNLWTGGQSFYAKMGKDGRILIRKLTLELLQDGKTSIEGDVLDVSIEPASSPDGQLVA